jgi:hypothetical protein
MILCFQVERLFAMIMNFKLHRLDQAVKGHMWSKMAWIDKAEWCIAKG